MKTFKNILAAAMAITTVANANAQQSADSLITINESERALLVAAEDNNECCEVKISNDGTLTVDHHGGFYGGVDGVYTSHHLTNNDGVGGVGNASTFGGELILGYTLNRKGWLLAIRPEVRAGYQSSFNSEGLKTGAHNNVLGALFVELSHGSVRPAVGLTYEHERLTSSREVTLDGGTLSVPYAAKAQYLGFSAQLSATVAKIGHTKVAQVGNKKVPVRGQFHVDLFAEGNLSFAKVNKFWTSDEAKTLGFEPELKDQKMSLKLGLRVFFR